MAEKSHCIICDHSLPSWVMKKLSFIHPLCIFLALLPLLHAHEYAHESGWIKPDAEKIGDGHGEVAVAENGEQEKCREDG